MMDTSGQEFDSYRETPFRYLVRENGDLQLQYRKPGTWGDGKEIWASVPYIPEAQVKPWREG